MTIFNCLCCFCCYCWEKGRREEMRQQNPLFWPLHIPIFSMFLLMKKEFTVIFLCVENNYVRDKERNWQKRSKYDDQHLWHILLCSWLLRNFNWWSDLIIMGPYHCKNFFIIYNTTWYSILYNLWNFRNHLLINYIQFLVCVE